MKIITVCKHGNNRSVQFSHLLKYKYKGSDVIPIGICSTSPETLKMLFDWADYILITHKEEQMPHMPPGYESKIRNWEVGEDHYHRPFNKELLAKAKKIIEDNPLT